MVGWVVGLRDGKKVQVDFEEIDKMPPPMNFSSLHHDLSVKVPTENR